MAATVIQTHIPQPRLAQFLWNGKITKAMNGETISEDRSCRRQNASLDFMNSAVVGRFPSCGGGGAPFC